MRGGADVFGQRLSVLGDSRRLTDGVRDLGKQVASGLLRSPGRPGRHHRVDVIGPESSQDVERSPEQLERVVNVENVLRLLVWVSLPVYQQLLDDEADRVGYEYVQRLSQRDTPIGPDADGPGRCEQQFEVP